MLSKFWKKIKCNWHHLMLPLAGALQIVEMQWSLVNAYFGKWAGAILVGIGLFKYGLNLCAAKKPVDCPPCEKDNDNPSVG